MLCVYRITYLDLGVVQVLHPLAPTLQAPCESLQPVLVVPFIDSTSAPAIQSDVQCTFISYPKIASNLKT